MICAIIVIASIIDIIGFCLAVRAACKVMKEIE